MYSIVSDAVLLKSKRLYINNYLIHSFQVDPQMNRFQDIFRFSTYSVFTSPYLRNFLLLLNHTYLRSFFILFSTLYIINSSNETTFNAMENILQVTKTYKI